MDQSASEIILHHYDSSPYSEKVRLVLGLKGLAWRSVQIPAVMPKPDLMPLTGGYRRTPVMQIGADVYCDTACIIRELDRRHPEPGLYPDGGAGLAWAVAAWADRPFFQASVALIFGTLGDNVPEAFIRDRQQLSGRSFDIAAMKAAVPVMRQQWRAHVDNLDCQLADGRPYLLGEAPGLADVHAYMNIWFVRMAGRSFGMPKGAGEFPGADILARFQGVNAWAERLAAIRHGRPEALDAEDALRVARDAKPMPYGGPDPDEPEALTAGMQVAVTPDDYGRVPVTGEVAHSGPQEIVLRRRDEQVGEVAVHFPRAGFIVTPTG